MATSGGSLGQRRE